MNKKKKWILVLLIPALLVGAVFGTYQILRANREPCKVYAASDLIMEDSYGYGSYLDGEVRMDNMQVFYTSSTQEITEILVSEGDRVKKGDPLLRFNTSLSELELERKAIEIQKAQDEMEKAQRTYRRYFKQDYVIPPISAGQNEPHPSGLSTRIGSGRVMLLTAPVCWSDIEATQPETAPTEPETVPTEPETVPTEPETVPTEPETVPTEPETVPTEPETVPTEPETEPTEPETEPTEPETEPTEPETEPTEPEEPVVDGVVRTIVLVDGVGTPEDPALYIVSSEYGLTPRLLGELLGSQEQVDLVIANTEEDRVDGNVISAFGLTLVREEKGWSVRFWNADAYLDRPLAPLDPDEPDPTEPDFPDFPDYPIGPVGPTREELQQIRRELEEKMRELDLQIRMDQVAYRSMEAELGDGVVRAEYDGVILTLNDPEYALEANEPLLKLSGGGGYKVVCSVNEFQVESIQPGMTAQVTSWWSGESYTGVVTEISKDPTSVSYYSSDIPQNISYYPVTLEVDASANMGEYYGVEVVLDGAEGEQSGSFLPKAFVLSENGRSYVMVRGQEGQLEKRMIYTGRDLYGQEIEILGGLTKEDYIAFPYAKAAQEGAKTVEGTMADLSGGMYY